MRFAEPHDANNSGDGIMAPFTITPVEKGIMRCTHTGSFTPDEVQSLASFLRDYHGKLLVDLEQASIEDCARHIKNLRPMMPTTALFGAKLPPGTLDIDRSYYVHEVCAFETEEEALTWLRNQ
jgi:hypothetical protein